MLTNTKTKEPALHKGAQSILNAALSFFSEKGFKSASINEIAKKAEVSKANIYHHFKSKECLYQQVLEEACDRLFTSLNTVEKSLPARPEDRLKTFFSEHLQCLLRYPVSTNLIKRELMDNNSIDGRLLAKELFSEIFSKIILLVQESQGVQKSSNGIDAPLLAFILVGMNMFFFESQGILKYLPQVNDFVDSPEFYSEEVFDLLIEGFKCKT